MSLCIIGINLKEIVLQLIDMKNLIMTFILIQPFFSLAQEDIDPKNQENNEYKCAVVITSRINDNQDPYQYALDRIRMCKKADILAVNSFLDSLTTKVYFNDLMRGFCDFEKQIIADVNKDSSSLSCVHVGKERPRRNLKLPLSLNKNNKTTYYKPDYRGGAHDQFAPGWNNDPTPLKEPGPSGTRP